MEYLVFPPRGYADDIQRVNGATGGDQAWLVLTKLVKEHGLARVRKTKMRVKMLRGWTEVTLQEARDLGLFQGPSPM